MDFTKLLPEFPEIGTLEVKEKNLRAFQLTKQTRVYYRIKTERITILTFFDVIGGYFGEEFEVYTKLLLKE